MKRHSTILIVLSFLLSVPSIAQSFKQGQLRYPRVRDAYDQKEKNLDSLLFRSHIEKSSIEIYLRIFKYRPLGS